VRLYVSILLEENLFLNFLVKQYSPYMYPNISFLKILEDNSHNVTYFRHPFNLSII